jgi:hypothetical protein
VSAGKVVLLVFGIIIVLIGLGLTTGGGGALWANAALTDDEGYFTTKTLQIDRSSHAVASEPTDVDVGSWWVWDWGDLATFKVEASNDDPSKNVFVGVADEGDLRDYLRDVDYDEVTDLEIRPDRLEYRNRPGSSEPAAPTTREFWLESVHGSGTQILEWELQSGSWSLVLMNEDGSADLDLSVVLGVKIPWLVGAAVGVLVGGIVALLLGVLMIVLAVRKPRGPRISEPGAGAPEEPPAPASATEGGGGPLMSTGYPVGLSIDYPDRDLNRLTTFFRIFWAIPIWIVLGLLAGAAFTCADDGWWFPPLGLGFFVILPPLLLIVFRQKYPRWWFDWNLAIAGFATRVVAYLALLRDEYPSTDEEQSVHIEIPYPNVEADLNRWLPLVKWFLAIPHYIVLWFLSIAAVVVVIIAWFVILFTGRYPRDLFDFVVGILRWYLRVVAYAFLMTTDRYPPFSFSE